MRSNPAVAALLLTLVAGLGESQLQAQDSIPSVLDRVGTLRSKRVRESSGAAISHRYPGIIWTHNDSGDQPMLYAINSAGDVLAVVRIPNARATDWEDLSLARCPDGDSTCLYIADTGDNSEKRKFVSLYVVPEPDPTLARMPGDTLESAPAHEVRFTYADGPHDVEALYVDSAVTASMITKGRNGRFVRYTLSRSALRRDSTVATAADTLAINPLRTLGRFVTGAAISTSNRRVVVRTYSELFFFRRRADGHLVPDGFPCWLGAAEPQGEGVTFLDEATVVLTSESLLNQDGPILRVRCSRPGS